MKKTNPNVINVPLGDSYLTSVEDVVLNNRDIDTIVLPNNRSCNAVKKILSKHQIILPNIVSLPDLFSVQNITHDIIKFLSSRINDVPFISIYNLSRSLFDLIQSLTLGNVDLSSINVPEALQSSWNHTFALLQELEKQPFFVRMKQMFHVKQSRHFDVLKNQKLLIVCIHDLDFYTKKLIDIATSTGFVIAAGAEIKDSYNYQRFSYICEKQDITTNNANIKKPQAKLIEFENSEDEAEGIAILVRRYVDQNQSVVIVCPEERLTKQIHLELQRWNITADKSSADYFSQTSAGQVFFAACLMLQNDFDNCSVLSFLKHNNLIREKINELEIFLRKQTRYPYNFLEMIRHFDWLNFIKNAKIDLNGSQGIETEKNDDSSVEMAFYMSDAHLNESIFLNENSVPKFLQDDYMKFAIDSLVDLYYRSSHKRTLNDWIELLCDFVKIINHDFVSEFQQILKQWSNLFDIQISRCDFCAFFSQYIIKTPMRSAVKSQHNVHILGVLEAQLVDADRIIICNANEEAWTLSNANDFWMSPAMLRQLKIDIHEKMQVAYTSVLEHRIFSPNVVVTRAKKKNGKDEIIHPLVAKIPAEIDHECLQILQALRKSNGNLSDQLAIAHPPIESRPTQLWVSDVDLLQNNPYAFYAKKILKLKDLAALNQVPNFKGNLMHEVLEKFVTKLSDCADLNKVSEIFSQLMIKYQHCYDYKDLWTFALDDVFKFVGNNTRQKATYFTEIEGSINLQIESDDEKKSVTISCKADCIEITSDGQLKIIDYKTGSVPTIASVKSGEKPQLAIEALIAHNDGFGIHKQEVSCVEFWSLKPKEKKRIVNVAESVSDTQTLISNTQTLLSEMLQKYYVDGDGYEVNCHDPYNNAFMHLARAKEVSVA